MTGISQNNTELQNDCIILFPVFCSKVICNFPHILKLGVFAFHLQTLHSNKDSEERQMLDTELRVL